MRPIYSASIVHLKFGTFFQSVIVVYFFSYHFQSRNKFLIREVKLDVYGKRQTAKIKLLHAVCLRLFVE